MRISETHQQFSILNLHTNLELTLTFSGIYFTYCRLRNSFFTGIWYNRLMLEK